MGLTLLDPRVWLALAAAMLIAFGLGMAHQGRQDTLKASAERLKAVDAARTREAQWQLDAEVADEVHQTEIRRIARARDVAVAKLRSRPERLPEVALSAGKCDGATGAQLARPDAEFLARFAAERDEIASRLQACQAWITSVTHPHP